MVNKVAYRAGVAVVIAATAALIGCQTTGPARPGPSVTIPYNPYDYDPDELNAAAQPDCGAYGLGAVYVDGRIDPSSVRWRYRHYDCV